MSSRVENYIKDYQNYQTFEKNHLHGAGAAVVLGVALVAIGFYLSGSLSISLAERAMGSIIGGAAFTTVGLTALVASYVLRGRELRESISSENLEVALESQDKHIEAF